MALGKRISKQADLWLVSSALPAAPGHPFYRKLNELLAEAEFDGRLANLGHEISDTCVGNILKEQGIEPAPERKRQTTWKTFLKAHWDVLAAVDFTTIEVWSSRGLVTWYLLFVMELATRSFRRLHAQPGRVLDEAVGPQSDCGR